MGRGLGCEAGAEGVGGLGETEERCTWVSLILKMLRRDEEAACSGYTTRGARPPLRGLCSSVFT